MGRTTSSSRNIYSLPRIRDREPKSTLETRFYENWREAKHPFPISCKFTTLPKDARNLYNLILMFS